MNTFSKSQKGRVNLWPVSIIAFFSLAIFGCVTFVAFCSRYPADLISPDYYEEEVHYQGQIERLHQTQQRAPLASVGYDPASRRITISVPEQAGAGRSSGQVQFYRPSSRKQDRIVKLDLDTHGVQTIDAAALIPGLWKIRITWTLEDKQFFIDQKLVIPSVIL